MTATPQPPPCRPPRRRLHWSLLGSLMIIVLTLGVTISHAVDCPECWEPNPDYDPNNPFTSEEPCAPKDNPCEGYEDWQAAGGGMECGICLNGWRFRTLGRCKEPRCPGCEEDYHPVAYQQYFKCDDWDWGRFFDSFDWIDILACIGTGIGCPSCLSGNIAGCVACLLGLPSCAREVCIALDAACGDCVLDSELELAPAYGCTG